MDYESRKIKWYWLFLFLLYSGGVVYLLFQGNPFLYSRQELQSALMVGETRHLQTIPTHPPEVKSAGATFQTRYNLERTAVDPTNAQHSKNYTEFEKYPVDLSAENMGTPSVAMDASGFYLAGTSPWVVAVGKEGQAQWKYRFKALAPNSAIYPVLLNDTSAYLVHPQGEIVCLDKTSGEIRWVLNLKQEVAATPLLWKHFLIVPSKSANDVQLTLIDVDKGHVSEESPHFDIKPGFNLSESTDLGVLLATVDNKIIAIDPEEWQVAWTQTVTDPIRGSAVVVGSGIYVATLAAKVTKLDGAKKGKIDWETDIVKPPAEAPTFLPVINKLSILDTSGFISLIEAKTGKVSWRGATENHNPLTETWSARLKGSHIEEFHMDWLQKGWTIWSPCYESGFCIYNPRKGQQLARIRLSGRPMALPLPFEKRWIFLLRGKSDQYAVAQVVEDSEIKKLQAEKVKSQNR